MKVGDLVMFVDEGMYAKWFYGKFGVVESSKEKIPGQGACRVRWLQPVKYFNSYTSYSDFGWDKFQVYPEELETQQ
ncbi:hypothetical protein CL634_09960 [bacterium]|nr:hypothetical protein [bacterium]